MKKTFVTGLAVIMLFAFTAVVSGENKGDCKMGKRMEMGQKMGMGGAMCPKMLLSKASELNLTAEQMEKLKKLSDKKPADKDAWKDMKENRGAISDELSKDKPDMDKIDAMIDEMAKKHAAQMKEHVRFMNETGSILTKEQKEILKKMKEDKRPDFKGKKDRAKNK